MSKKVNVAVVGLGFGASFVPIYLRHPGVGKVTICDPNLDRLNQIGDEFCVVDRYSDLDQVLGDPSVDAVHLLTPVPLHVEQTLEVLASGKHCACAVPMATDLEGLAKILGAEKRTGLNYMMMETAVYTREFLFAQDMHQRGEFGTLTFLRGTYFQDLDGDYPLYWHAQPPMHYATHAIAPLLALAQTRATRVACFGAGSLRPDLRQEGGNTFPLQTAIFQLDGTKAVAEVTRSWFQTARSYTEAFSVYGDHRGFEWQQIEDENPVVYTLEEARPKHRRNAKAERIHAPLRPDLYPTELAEFADGWHGGSHPHLAHEFISSIVEGRPSRIDARTAADWTAPGICANESSLRGGEIVLIPAY